jgi:hypothetical protein
LQIVYYILLSLAVYQGAAGCFLCMRGMVAGWCCATCSSVLQGVQSSSQSSRLTTQRSSFDYSVATAAPRFYSGAKIPNYQAFLQVWDLIVDVK